MNEETKKPQSCMNCSKRINGNECVVKKVFAQNFQNAGARYKKSIHIIDSESNNCGYWEQSENTKEVN